MYESQLNQFYHGSGEDDTSSIASDQFSASYDSSSPSTQEIILTGFNKVSSAWAACDIQVDLSQASDFTYEIDPSDPQPMSFVFEVDGFVGEYTSQCRYQDILANGINFFGDP